MQIELSPEEAAILLESLKYSKRNIRDAQDTPYEVQQQNLRRVDAVKEKLRAAMKTGNRGKSLQTSE